MLIMPYFVAPMKFLPADQAYVIFVVLFSGFEYEISTCMVMTLYVIINAQLQFKVENNFYSERITTKAIAIILKHAIPGPLGK
jgi:hypothetical protein